MLITADGSVALDVCRPAMAAASSEPQQIYDQWDEFTSWASTVDLSAASATFELEALGAPAPSPKQVFAIGLNFRAHAAESKPMCPTSRR